MTTRVDAEPSAEISVTSDTDLIARVTEGDTGALEILYDRYSRVVYSFALRIVGDPLLAEELLQEVFLRTWQQGAAFKAARGSFITWLLSITHNMAIDEVRKRRRRPQRADNEDPDTVFASMMDEGQDVEEEAWLSSLRSIMSDALQILPPAQREAIELAYFQGLTQREISDRLGEPLGTIKTRMRLGIQKLREQLGDQLGDVMLQRSEVDEA